MDINTMIRVPSIEDFTQSIYTSAPSPVYVSDRMSGKMSGIPSISTACRLNPYCRERAKVKDSVCSHCFAMATTARYHSLEKRLEDNYELLVNHILPMDMLPRFKRNIRIVRLESFGDLASEKQAANYLNICVVNPHVSFALWTKNPKLLKTPIEMLDKPENLKIVYSSPNINEEMDIKKRYPFIDIVFTVYDAEHFDAAPGFHCAGKSCADYCHCYLDEGDVKEKLR